METKIIGKKVGIDPILSIPVHRLRENASITSFNPYGRRDGDDARSLKVTVNDSQVNYLSIKFDGNNAYVVIDWSKISLISQITVIRLLVTGNHNVNIPVTLSISFPKEKPAITLLNNQFDHVWGSGEPIRVLFNGIDHGHDSWRYSFDTKVFIPKYSGFYLKNCQECTLFKTKGYLVNINPWGGSTIDLYYDYGNCAILTSKKDFISLVVLYSEHDRFTENKQLRLNVEFTPCAPSLHMVLQRVSDRYVLGTPDTEVFKATISKGSVYSPDLVNVQLGSNSDKITIVSSNNDTNTFSVCIRKTAFRDIPNRNVDVVLTAQANGARSVEKIIILTGDITSSDNVIQLVKQSFLQVDERSDVKINDRIELYVGVETRILTLRLSNTSQVDFGKVHLEITSGDVRFNNGKYATIHHINHGDFGEVDIYVPSSEINTTDYVITAKTDYSESLNIPLSVSVKERLVPSLAFSFKQTKQLYYEEEYNNVVCGVLTVKTECEQNIDAYSNYDLKKYPVEIQNEYFKIKLDNEYDIKPNMHLCYEVIVDGKIPTQSLDRLKVCSNDNRQDITIDIEEKKYQTPKYFGFFPCNDNCRFTFTPEDRICIGTLYFYKFEDHDQRFPIDGVIGLSDGLSFEDGENEAVYDAQFFKGKKIYFNAKDFFGNVQNICSEKEFRLKLTQKYLNLIEKTDDYGQSLFILPIEANAKLVTRFEFEEDLKNEYGDYIIHYSIDDLNDESIDICNLIFTNATSIPFYPKGNEENDCVKISNIRISSTPDVLCDSKLEDISIDNGGNPYVFTIKLDWDKWKKVDDSKIIQINVRYNYNGHEENGDIYIVLEELRTDRIYSLDLGTTGIVMAKQEDYEITTIPLTDAKEDKEDCIENATDIISSTTVLFKDNLEDEESDDNETKGCHQILMSPATLDFNAKTASVFVPAKFVVGQDRIPYIELCKKHTDRVFFSPQITSKYKKDDDNLVNEDYIFSLDENDNNYLSPDMYLQNVYDSIFNRIGTEGENIQKLILSYPNTYTPSTIATLKDLIEGWFPQLEGFVNMVPESDAVVAYYFDKRINSCDENSGIKDGQETVLIYDMGAGTLDLSLVVISKEGESITADIEKKIGIPIAGNYLDWVLYNGYFEKFRNNTSNENYDSDKDDRDIKDYIKRVKIAYQKEESPNPIESIESKCLDLGDNLTYKDLDKTIAPYLEICSTTILKLFLGKRNIDRIVFSGRASQFAPLRERILKWLKENGSESVFADGTICQEELKTCVAEGAIVYFNLFDNDDKLKITNRNQYQNIGVVYLAPIEGGGQNKVYYKELLSPQDANWDEAIMIEGTRCLTLSSSETIDLSVKGKNFYIVQTQLSAEEVVKLYEEIYFSNSKERTNTNWVFINELFKFNSSSINVADRKSVEIRMSLNQENELCYKIGRRNPPLQKVTERLENNIFYQRSMWPYVKFNK